MSRNSRQLQNRQKIKTSNSNKSRAPIGLPSRLERFCQTEEDEDLLSYLTRCEGDHEDEDFLDVSYGITETSTNTVEVECSSTQTHVGPHEQPQQTTCSHPPVDCKLKNLNYFCTYDA